jgi:hypothetical protein
MTEDETTVPAEGNNKESNGQNVPQPASVPAVAPVVAAVPTPAQVTEFPAQPEKENFAKILEEVKLPERRNFKAGADIPTAPTDLPEAAILEEHIIKKAEVPAQNPQPAQPANATPESEPQNVERSSSIVSPLRTLKDDLQTVVREQKISLVHAVTLEQEKKHGQEHLAPEQQEIKTRRTRRTVGAIFASGIFVLLGAAALYGVFFVIQQQQSIPPAPQASILFAEKTVTFPLDGQTPGNLKATLAQARTQQLGALGSIIRVVPTIMSTTTGSTPQAQPATLAQFFSALGMNPPQELVDATGPDFFFGFHVVDTNAPLLVIPVTSYDHAFAGMLAWEPTMDSDLSPIFTQVSMTIATSGIPVERTFQDAVMRNYDVRELTDDSGNIVLYYSFPTPDILVIAQSPYSFTEILSRLQAQREL